MKKFVAQLCVALTIALAGCSTGTTDSGTSPAPSSTKALEKLDDYVGKNLQDAGNALKAKGVEVEYVAQDPSQTISSPSDWTITKQEPKAGTASGKVTLTAKKPEATAAPSKATAAPSKVATAPTAKSKAPAIPVEYTNALKNAEKDGLDNNRNKARLLRYLTSEAGGKFSQAAAQYAADNVKADWKDRALKSARFYKDASITVNVAGARITARHLNSSPTIHNRGTHNQGSSSPRSGIRWQRILDQANFFKGYTRIPKWARMATIGSKSN